jgi:hypothetical protein
MSIRSAYVNASALIVVISVVGLWVHLYSIFRESPGDVLKVPAFAYNRSYGKKQFVKVCSALLSSRACHEIHTKVCHECFFDTFYPMILLSSCLFLTIDFYYIFYIYRIRNYL